jgi:hypothetical protein
VKYKCHIALFKYLGFWDTTRGEKDYTRKNTPAWERQQHEEEQVSAQVGRPSFITLYLSSKCMSSPENKPELKL